MALASPAGQGRSEFPAAFLAGQLEVELQTVAAPDPGAGVVLAVDVVRHIGAEQEIPLFDAAADAGAEVLRPLPDGTARHFVVKACDLIPALKKKIRLVRRQDGGELPRGIDQDHDLGAAAARNCDVQRNPPHRCPQSSADRKGFADCAFPAGKGFELKAFFGDPERRRRRKFAVQHRRGVVQQFKFERHRPPFRNRADRGDSQDRPEGKPAAAFDDQALRNPAGLEQEFTVFKRKLRRIAHDIDPAHPAAVGRARIETAGGVGGGNLPPRRQRERVAVAEQKGVFTVAEPDFTVEIHIAVEVGQCRKGRVDGFRIEVVRHHPVVVFRVGRAETVVAQIVPRVADRAARPRENQFGK